MYKLFKPTLQTGKNNNNDLQDGDENIRLFRIQTYGKI